MNFIELIKSNMTDEDIKLLDDIYSPEEVAVCDKDAWNSLCVTRSGAIRYYGRYRPKNIFEFDTARRCYIESTDGGLTWKRHLKPDGTLGAGDYIPFLDKYMEADFTWKTGITIRIANDIGAPIEEEYKLPFEGLAEPMHFTALKSRNRILMVCTENRFDLHPTAYFQVLLWSDDGRNWHKTTLSPAKFFEKTFPHKGMRWEQNNREAAVAELDDGTILMITRTANDFHYMATSTDGGESFSEFTPTTFHSDGTMPKLLKLSDGRLLFCFCNTKAMPERAEADGMWEDFFTNRDVCHAAISEDDGKTWRGFRELRLSPIRHNHDLRSAGGPEDGGDKSVHQFELIELPDGKILMANGQHRLLSRLLIFDPNWLYETSRKEDLLHGFENLSCQGYVESIPGGYRGLGYAGHCAYNRINTALLLPSPENNGKEALFLAPQTEPHLISKVSGAVWNFPALRKGKLTLRAYLPGGALRLSLLDHWFNPTDDSVEYFAPFSVNLRRDMQDGELFTTFEIEFDTENMTARLSAGKYLDLSFRMNGEAPNGLCYLHLQYASDDMNGAYITGWEVKGEN